MGMSVFQPSLLYIYIHIYMYIYKISKFHIHSIYTHMMAIFKCHMQCILYRIYSCIYIMYIAKVQASVCVYDKYKKCRYHIYIQTVKGESCQKVQFSPTNRAETQGGLHDFLHQMGHFFLVNRAGHKKPNQPALLDPLVECLVFKLAFGTDKR